MKKFKLILDTMEGLAPKFHGLYEKGEDGKYHLDSELATEMDVSGLTSALEKERKNARTFKAELDAWKALGETPENVTSAMNDLKEQVGKGTEGKANWEKMKTELETGHQKELAKREEALKGMRTTLEQHLIDADAVQHITEAKGASKLLLPHIRGQAKVVEENGKFVVRIVDGDGDFRGNSAGGYMTIKDLVSEMRGSDEFGRAFESEQKAGGGKPPAGGGGKPLAGGGKPDSPLSKISAGLAIRQR